MSEAKSEDQHLEKTIDALENSIKNESATGSSTAITSWIKTLSDHKGFQTIVHDLEKLKEAIADKDGKKVYTLLEKLGNETVKAAEKAEGGENKAITKLGKTLLKGSKLVEKLVGKDEK
ncbi:hypothetical protein MUGA111182_08835 [Mucilaginibacter galii]|uniref:Uncharacterized protein n=1 Tax=Mucilaginibacter galii TaxID=2005073 RepID=A0A917J8Y2_9SPHI|nr:hypothetical protein [Mucilaginibacter galii]GGI49469.1 hypothetical protein GCM10011425_06810 [Mucilaginibacter galii]